MSLKVYGGAWTHVQPQENLLNMPINLNAFRFLTREIHSKQFPGSITSVMILLRAYTVCINTPVVQTLLVGQRM